MALTPPPQMPDVPEQELNDTQGPDVLDSRRVLGLAQSVHDGAGLVFDARRGVHFIDRLQIFHGVPVIAETVSSHTEHSVSSEVGTRSEDSARLDPSQGSPSHPS